MALTNAIKYFYCLLVVIILSPQIKGCTLIEFRCNSGQCIGINERCNGPVNCYDGSDESPELCKTSTTQRSNNRVTSPTPRTQGITVSPNGKGTTPKISKRFGCELGEFTCLNGECINQDYVCDERKDCSDGSDESTTFCATNNPTTPDEFDINSNSKFISCSLPPQPSNGRWKLHKSLCIRDRNCDPPPNLREMQPGSYLVYNCDLNYNLKGDSDVLCGPGGKWVKIPTCEQIHCEGLSNSAREAYCTLNSQKIVCNVPVPTHTRAKLRCRDSYVEEITQVTTSTNVTCQANGQWSPQPIKCSSIPGKVKIVVEGDVLVGREKKEIEN